ncbi:MAG: GntR family transcriptional regulator [Paracoccaceae bacterium]|nr:GntR family transcriptional regulator [Paracoccaceae bacterium]
MGADGSLGVLGTDNDNLGAKIYRTLKTRLIIGDVAPNDCVSIRKLAGEFGVSTMPVREALERLESENALAGSTKPSLPGAGGFA